MIMGGSLFQMDPNGPDSCFAKKFPVESRDFPVGQVGNPGLMRIFFSRGLVRKKPPTNYLWCFKGKGLSTPNHLKTSQKKESNIF